MPDIQRLVRIAEGEIHTLKAALPPPLTGRAETIPVVLMDRPSPAMLRDGLEPDLLGIFMGPNDLEAGEEAPPMPAEILLFIENLWQFAEQDEEDFREEVCITYLHELGHALGLEEEDLDARGLW